jgi:HPt (histidine-containing phosphotransfer) domain-containing protein
MFVDDRAACPAQVARAIEAGDWKAAARLVHSVKGMSGVLGASDLHSAAAGLEREIGAMKSASAPPDPPASLTAALSQFAAASDATRDACRSALDGPGR